MKKAAALITGGLGYLVVTAKAFAQNTGPIPVNLPTNLGGVPSNAELSTVLGNVLRIIFVIATLAVLFMLVIGAFQWITSGGDKEAVGKARGRITSALIGLAILALAVFIVVIVSRILNIQNPFSGTIPTLTTP